MDASTRALDSEILSFIRKYADRPASDAAFNALALKIFRYQYERNVPYRRWCASEGKSPANASDWKDIPAVPAAAFKRLKLKSFSEKETRVFRTSGTLRRAMASPSLAQGKRPARGAHYFDTLKLYDAAILPPFRRAFLADKPKLSWFFLMPDPAEARDSSLSHMMGVVKHAFAGGKGRYYVRRRIPDYQRLTADLKRAKGKVFLLSTAFALKGFLDYLSEKRTALKLAPGSRLMETGGFKGRAAEVSKKQLYRLCGRFLGIPVRRIVSEYGMTELSSQYYDGRPPAWLRAVVVDPFTGREARAGRTGLLRHVDLANRGSAIAVETEDLGRAVKGRIELLGRAPQAVPRGCSLAFEEFLKR